jgi:hypothetical protein
MASELRISDWERAILSLLAERGAAKTICPSEVARKAVPSQWRSQMPRVREAAKRLAARGDLEITQRGQVVDPYSTFKGPIRLRLRPVGDR